jgi:hypothetical protein
MSCAHCSFWKGSLSLSDPTTGKISAFHLFTSDPMKVFMKPLGPSGQSVHSLLASLSDAFIATPVFESFNVFSCHLDDALAHSIQNVKKGKEGEENCIVQ